MLEIRELTPSDKEIFLDSYKYWSAMDITWYSFVWKPGMEFHEHLQILNDQKDQNKLAPQRVPSTMLYAFKDNKIVGRVSIRHGLNDFLLNRGGHIGYAVAPEFRRLGIATMLYQAGLNFCKKKLGLKEILVTCSDHNIGSIRVIEKNNHKLENKILDENKDELIRRYWVEL